MALRKTNPSPSIIYLSCSILIVQKILVHFLSKYSVVVDLLKLSGTTDLFRIFGRSLCNRGKPLGRRESNYY